MEPLSHSECYMKNVRATAMLLASFCFNAEVVPGAPGVDSQVVLAVANVHEDAVAL